MFSNLLVATDGSEHADNALDVAINLALKYDASLHIVHVLMRDMATGELAHLVESEHLDDSYHASGAEIHIESSSHVAEHGMMRSGDRDARVVSVIANRIIGAAERKAKAAGLSSVSSSVLSGDSANAILQAAEDHDSSMIIMGRRGLSTLKGFMTGSVSHKVSQRAACSVLTVK